MKFAQYLAENQTPEWKRAYIDYKACKKAIKIVGARMGRGKEIKDGVEVDSSDNDADHGPSAHPLRKTNSKGSSTKDTTPSFLHRSLSRQVHVSPTVNKSPTSPRYGSTAASNPLQRIQSNPPPLDIGEPSVPPSSSMKGPDSGRVRKGTVNFAPDDAESEGDDGHITSDSMAPLARSPVNSLRVAGKSPRVFGKSSPRIVAPQAKDSPRPSTRSIRSMTLPSPRLPIRTARNFADLYAELETDEKAFFDLLDHELEKVEDFYDAREADAFRRCKDLQGQLTELAEHRRIFHELYPEGMPEWETKVGKLLPGNGAGLKALHLRNPFTQESEAENGRRQSDAKYDESSIGLSLREAMKNDKDHKTYNPERYQKYRKELKEAVLDYYRQLELIKNYRIMNFTGFRKALKKFEKTTKIHCMELYTDEKIMKESFSKGDKIDGLIKQVEEMFTEHFEHGDSKRARDKLRKQNQHTTHYYSVFRSGIYLGLGFPPALMGLIEALQKHTHDDLLAWDGLLQVYGGLFLPIIFAMLFELNLNAFVNARINYERHPIRRIGSKNTDWSFIIWILAATASSVYTSSWDIVVDWSLLRPNSKLLRPDLGYGNRYVYYFAMVTNVFIRFIFIWYIPYSTRIVKTRSFIFALLEMLRRWQWNFFRVETEHLGNADAYRVTREIPLPYRKADKDSDEEDVTPSKEKGNSMFSVQLDKLRRGFTGGDGRGPNELNVGARGHAGQREYEARRPGDSNEDVV
ncbi:hypothetical protein P7C73_g4278, partial [Tremellales sp. Uapishka_1]